MLGECSSAWLLMVVKKSRGGKQSNYDPFLARCNGLERE
jgi:hypothetical protein